MVVRPPFFPNRMSVSNRSPTMQICTCATNHAGKVRLPANMEQKQNADKAMRTATSTHLLTPQAKLLGNVGQHELCGLAHYNGLALGGACRDR